MFRVTLRLFSDQIRTIVIFSGVIAVLMLLAPTSVAQRSKGGVDTPDEAQGGFQFRGVKIGMVTDEARKKLGAPKEKSPEQDFYVFNDNEAVQIYYLKGAVSAISIDYMSGASGVPTPKDVLGAEAEAKADGSIYKVVRYPKAGYWVSYSRTAGDEPTITITMQKIQ